MHYLGLDLPCIHDVDDRGVLSRFPNELNQAIGHKTACQLYAQEIRLIPEETVSITLVTADDFSETKCEIFYGDYCMPHEITFRKEVTLEIQPFSLYAQENREVPAQIRKNSRFDLEVVRLVVFVKSLMITEVKGRFHLPKAEQLPKESILVYGTSISQGTGSHVAHGTYPWLLARRLGMDIRNYSLAGSCLLETEVVSFLSSLPDHHNRLIVLEPSTNLYAQGYSLSQFQQRLAILYERIRSAYPHALLVWIDMFPSLFDFGYHGTFTPSVTAAEYRFALGEFVHQLQEEQVLLVEAKDLLSASNLSQDLLHPSTSGYFEIAEQLYRRLQPYL